MYLRSTILIPGYEGRVIFEDAEDEWVDLQARQLIREYWMVKRGEFTYQDLGYRAIDGSVPYRKVEEFLFMNRVAGAAYQSRKKPR